MADKRKLLAEEKNLLNQIQSRQSELNSLLEQNLEDERAREKSLSIQARLKEKIVEKEKELANTTESINKKLNQQAKVLEGVAEGAIGKIDSLLGRVPLLGDTLSQTFRESTQSLAGDIAETFVQSGGQAKQFGKLFGGISRGIGTALRVAFGPIGILLTVGAALVAIVQRFAKLDALVQNTRKNLGITRSESVALISNLSAIDKRREAQLEVIQQINDELGFTPKITRQTANEIDVMRRKFKLTAEEAAAITTFNMASGQSLKEFNNELEATLKAENERNKIAVSGRAVTAELANLSESTKLAFRGQTSELVKQIAATKRIGINMERARDIARGLVDIEASLEAQFQLEALTGRTLNLDRVRMLAMDVTTQAQAVEELAIQLGPAAMSNNVIIQDAIGQLDLNQEDVARVLNKANIVNEAGQTSTEEALAGVRSVGEKTNDLLGEILGGVNRIANTFIFRGFGARLGKEPTEESGPIEAFEGFG